MAALSGEPSEAQVRSNLRASVADGASYSLMVGLGETYFAPFVLALGLGEVAAGLVATIPLLAGALLQLASPAGVRRLGSHKRWVVLCVTAQALSLAPLALLAWNGYATVWTVFTIVAVYWASGLAAGPAWNTWMGRIVPLGQRARFFALRTRVTHACALAGLLIGGWLLHSARETGPRLMAFTFIFAVAVTARLLSAWFLTRQTEPPLTNHVHERVPVRSLLQRSRTSGDGRLLTYMLALQTAVYVSGPYFTPYMLEQLHFEYWQFVLLTATSYLSKSLALPLLGRIAHHFGPHRLLATSGLAVVPLAGLWMFGGSLPYLLCLQVAAGAAWAGYELATFLLMLETIREHERTSLLTTFNLLNSCAMVTGSLVGGGILSVMGESVTSYMLLFGLSTVLRVPTLALLRGLRAVELPPHGLELRTISVRPQVGSLEQPVLPSLVEEQTVEAADEVSVSASVPPADAPIIASGGEAPLTSEARWS